MLYLQRRPAPPLHAHVECIWLCRNQPRPLALERVLPTGAAQLIVNLSEDETRMYAQATDGFSCRVSSGTVLTGVSTRFQIIDTAEQQFVAGIVFRPGGTLPLIGSPASEFTDADIDLENLCGRACSWRLRELLLAATDPETTLDVLERWLTALFRDRPRHPAVAFALAEFHTQPFVARIDAVKQAISLSPKRFIERFKTEVGVTPKRYCRLLRFQRAVAAAHATQLVDWTQLALDCGYFDQAHFIHEFREFSGLTPSAYQSVPRLFQNHVTFLQAS